ncbi:MAG: tRNA (N6-isopentenyl adenosine(37)-C2)-methylthiotransferase MiaB [Kiritimatiellae bacterium]|nr:tRNA (N6-isopentenyl adenosine(37)-C2)-methylthiotransferase MiaB [Kiritimatiellia bacterium]
MSLRFHIHTYGCQMNVRDSEAVAAMLAAAGHVRAEGEEDADLVVVNSCTVRQKAEEKAVGKVGNLIAAGKIVGLAGCAAERMGEEVFRRLPKLHFAVGPRQLWRIPAIVAEFESAPPGRRQRHVLAVGAGELPRGLDAHLAAADGSFAAVQSYVTVMVGCDNRCSYCIVPSVRGHEWCRPEAEIVAEVKCLAARGVKEVCLLGQSVLRYRGDGGRAFPHLLRELQEVEGLERIRFTSAHPAGCTEELLAAYRDCPKVCRHLHLPVQSGSDRILKSMGRRYDRAEYLDAVARLRAFDPEFALTTDVIVGYPGETEEDFEATRSLMEEAGFDNAFVFKYSPRPGTRAAEMADDVPAAEKERRDQVLLADQERRGLERNLRLVGSLRAVLAEGPSKRNRERWSGRDSGNRIVVFPPVDGVSVGDEVEVRVAEAHAQILVGEVVK